MKMKALKYKWGNAFVNFSPAIEMYIFSTFNQSKDENGNTCLGIYFIIVVISDKTHFVCRSQCMNRINFVSHGSHHENVSVRVHWWMMNVKLYVALQLKLVFRCYAKGIPNEQWWSMKYHVTYKIRQWFFCSFEKNISTKFIFCHFNFTEKIFDKI